MKKGKNNLRAFIIVDITDSTSDLVNLIAGKNLSEYLYITPYDIRSACTGKKDMERIKLEIAIEDEEEKAFRDERRNKSVDGLPPII